MDVKFKFEKFQGFLCYWGQNSPFPIDFTHGPRVQRYRAACDTYICSLAGNSCLQYFFNTFLVGLHVKSLPWKSLKVFLGKNYETTINCSEHGS